MIEIVCDNCERTFTVDDDQAGSKAPCPECGDVNRIPAAGGPPLADLPPEEGPEEQIVALRPAMFRARPFVYCLIVTLFVGGLIGAAYGTSTGQTWIIGAGGAALVIAALWWLGWYVNHLCEKISITNKRTIYRRGLLSRHTSEVLHNHIRNLQVHQSLAQRILNVGDLLLDSSAGGGDTAAEIRVADIPRPGKVKAIIDQYRSW